MKTYIPCPDELMTTLAELREFRRISNAEYGVLHKKLQAGEAQEVNLELYRTDQISSRQLNRIEAAIERDRILEEATQEK